MSSTTRQVHIECIGTRRRSDSSAASEYAKLRVTAADGQPITAEEAIHLLASRWNPQDPITYHATGWPMWPDEKAREEGDAAIVFEEVHG